MKLIEIQTLYEAKQVGILYHFTTPMSLVKIIADDFNLKPASERKKGGMLGSGEGRCVSFTRKHDFTNQQEGYLLARLIIDGNRLSQKYKIKPHGDPRYGKIEAEERICNKIVDVSDCILGIEVYDDWLLVNDFGYSAAALKRIDKILRNNPHIHFTDTWGGK